MRRKQNVVPDGQISLPGFFEPAITENTVIFTPHQKIQVIPPSLDGMITADAMRKKTESIAETTCAVSMTDYYPALPLLTTSSGERVQQNIAALKLINAAKWSCTGITSTDQEQIASYTGWDSVFSSHTEKEAVEKALAAEFSPEVVQSVLSVPEYPYNPAQWAIKAIYSALSATGFSGENILCTGAGNGAFWRAMPEEMRTKSRLSAEATDDINQDILSLLYPSIKTYGVQDEIPSSFFDAVIGLIPVSPNDMPILQFKGQTAAFERYAYHISKALYALRTGGILAMLIPSNTTDSMAQKPSPFDLSGTPLLFAGGLRLDMDSMGNKKSYDLLCFQKCERVELSRKAHTQIFGKSSEIGSVGSN